MKKLVDGILLDLTESEQADFDEAQAIPPTIGEYTAAVQSLLDNKAQERNYDNMLSMCTYVSSTNVKFAAEGQAGVEWRDACWSACYDIMAEVQVETRPVPTVAELLALMPGFVWPV